MFVPEEADRPERPHLNYITDEKGTIKFVSAYTCWLLGWAESELVGMHAMLRLADRFLVLDHGAVLAEGPPQQVVEDRTVIEAYLGTKFLAQHHNPADLHA